MLMHTFYLYISMFIVQNKWFYINKQKLTKNDYNIVPEWLHCRRETINVLPRLLNIPLTLNIFQPLNSSVES